MSHIATIKLRIDNLPALARACKRLGLELMQGQASMKSFQDGLKCEHAIRHSGNMSAYEVGLVKSKDGGYEMVYDNFDYHLTINSIAHVAGDGLEKIRQLYAAEVAANQASIDGWCNVQINFNEQGLPIVTGVMA